MLRTMTLAMTLALAGAAAPAAAQGWVYDDGFGPPIYGGPPAVYYEPPIVYERAPPPRAYYRQAPVMAVPARPRALDPLEIADRILDDLEDAGYREISPMRQRGDFFELRAVDPYGDLVALQVSLFTGEIEDERILEERRRDVRALAPVIRAAPAAPAPAAPARRAAAPEPAPVVAAAPPPPPRPSTAAPSTSATPPSTLRERLKPLPEEPAEGERDPLVVY